VTDQAAEALSLLSATAVRQRAGRMLALAERDQLAHFRLDPSRLDAVADLVLATMARNYPAGDIPFHARWRHFVVGGQDRWAAIAAATTWRDAPARLRAEFDLAIVSVLLDAGAGPDWRYRDPASGKAIGRSEGLALASLDMFAAGLFSADPSDPLRVDAARLVRLALDDLRRGLQVTPDNPLVGLEGRLDLLHRLGAQIAADPAFARADTSRPGGLADLLTAGGRSVPAADILVAVLRHLGPIWPSRITLAGVPLGDCWRHPALVTGDATTGLVPLHKLSQWLTYSLIEPLQRAGIDVTDIDGLTGLAEYRNGGLFVDGGVLVFRDPADAGLAHAVESELVIEWRALTVALLDRLAEVVRRRLGRDAASFPLARLLEGGTWAAGRVLAFERRPDGSPPVRVISDGTVF
jgi:hypothetical protein